MKLKPLVKEWVEKAEGDYATAQRELRNLKGGAWADAMTGLFGPETDGIFEELNGALVA